MTVQTFWAKLKKVGWLKYVPKALRAEMRARFARNFKSDPEWAYLSLNQTGFDSECIDGADSYRDLLKNLAKDSSGVFRPTQLKAENVQKGRKSSIKVSFRHQGKAFACVVPFETDYFEPKVLDLVNDAMESCGREERFIVLPSDEQLVFIAIVPPNVYDRAVKEKLIPPADAFDEDEDDDFDDW